MLVSSVGCTCRTECFRAMSVVGAGLTEDVPCDASFKSIILSTDKEYKPTTTGYGFSEACYN